jgi:hypothetical protein
MLRDFLGRTEAPQPAPAPAPAAEATSETTSETGMQPQLAATTEPASATGWDLDGTSVIGGAVLAALAIGGLTRFRGQLSPTGRDHRSAAANRRGPAVARQTAAPPVSGGVCRPSSPRGLEVRARRGTTTPARLGDLGPSGRANPARRHLGREQHSMISICHPALLTLLCANAADGADQTDLERAA